MAKSRGIIKLSGKIGEEIYEDREKGQTVKKSPKKSAKNQKAALERQNNRSAFLNQLASELNIVADKYSREFKSPKFYQSVQRRFRKEPEDNRWFLLKTLEKLEINPHYPLIKLSEPDIEWKQEKGRIDITVKNQHHPPVINEADCYSYDVVILTWDKSEQPPKTLIQVSEWHDMTEGAKFRCEFPFKIPAGTVHWMLWFGMQLGVENKSIGNMATCAMRLTYAGTFEEKEEALRNSRKKKEAKKKAINDPRDGLPRVKAKRE